jgi:hypothetical protein
MRTTLAAFAVILSAFTVPAWAGAALLDAPQLAETMKAGEPCCVIDAREEGRRKQQPIPFALVYRDGLKLGAAGFAVVVADSDDKALAVAQTLGQTGKTVYAVKGGYEAWRQTPAGVASTAAPETAAPRNFVIPGDTCEHGKPLQEFK